MIKYKRGNAYEISQRTWELLNEKQRGEFTEEGGYEIEQIQLNEKHADLQKNAPATIEVIELDVVEAPKQEITEKPATKEMTKVQIIDKLTECKLAFDKTAKKDVLLAQLEQFYKDH